jgi:hypothetical protein
VTRTNVTQGPWVTFTLLFRISETVGRSCSNLCAIAASPKIIVSYPAAHGGRADTWLRSHLPVAEETIACEPRGSPRHWPRISGTDFGWDHLFAAVELWMGPRHRQGLRETMQPRARGNGRHPCGGASSVGVAGAPRDSRRETLEGAGISWAPIAAPRVDPGCACW